MTYTLDANGSLTSDGLHEFEYDAANRLSRMRTTQNTEPMTVRYLHNAAGQRVFRSEPAGELAVPNSEAMGAGFVAWLKSRFGWLFSPTQADALLGTVYLYGDGELPAWALLGEYDNGSAQGRGRTEYIWLPLDDGSAIPVGFYRSGKLYAVHTDHLGTPRLVTDDEKRPVWQWPYSAFGDNKPTGPLVQTAPATGDPPRLKRTEPIEFGLRFPGQHEDAEAGVYYNFLRWYHAKNGRFTQADPIGLAGGPNRFAYVGGNPFSYTDPKGLWRNPSDIYDDATRDARRSGLPGPHNGLQDAYRHCLASCEMARENTGAVAQCLGWLNEKKGDWLNNQERGERQMDDFANAVGFGLGRTAQSYQSCQAACLGAASTGGLNTYLRGTTTGYWY